MDNPLDQIISDLSSISLGHILFLLIILSIIIPTSIWVSRRLDDDSVFIKGPNKKWGKRSEVLQDPENREEVEKALKKMGVDKEKFFSKRN